MKPLDELQSRDIFNYKDSSWIYVTRHPTGTIHCYNISENTIDVLPFDAMVEQEFDVHLSICEKYPDSLLMD